MCYLKSCCFSLFNESSKSGFHIIYNVELSIMNNTGTIEYVVDTNELEPNQLVLESIHDQITSVDITAKETQLIMKFHTIDVLDEDEESAMNNIAYRCFTSLAHKYGFSFRNMRRGGSTLPKRDGSLSTVVKTFGLSWNIEAPKKSIEGDVSSLLEQSICTNEYDIQLIHQYVIARSELDNVSRFMFLYNLALQVHSDNQRILDKFILCIEPSCIVSPSPRFDRHETIYTRLRNEVAHCRDNTNIEATRKEIDGVVNKFQEVVYEMLPTP